MEADELMSELEGHRASIFEKLVEPVNNYIMCKLKMLQLEKVGKERNHFNASHLEMLRKLAEEASFHADFIQKQIQTSFDNQ
jgi:hypothetical protein